jgi:hypothetical protein
VWSVEDALSHKLATEQEEAQEINRRKNCVIVHGMMESKGDKCEIRGKEALDTCSELFHQINCDDVSLGSCIRLGRSKRVQE